MAPINWPEPFGLFLVEAMARGTSVVVFNRGSAPEMGRHGVTGYVVDTVAEMADSVRQVGRIDPGDRREHVERNFNIHIMALEPMTHRLQWP